jgi:hypothetical protein
MERKRTGNQGLNQIQKIIIILFLRKCQCKGDWARYYWCKSIITVIKNKLLPLLNELDIMMVSVACFPNLITELETTKTLYLCDTHGYVNLLKWVMKTKKVKFQYNPKYTEIIKRPVYDDYVIRCKLCGHTGGSSLNVIHENSCKYATKY